MNVESVAHAILRPEFFWSVPSAGHRVNTVYRDGKPVGPLISAESVPFIGTVLYSLGTPAEFNGV